MRAEAFGRQWGGVALLLAPIALLPFGRAAEAAIALAALLGLLLALRGRIEWRAPAVRLSGLVFLAYWLPELASAPDAVVPARAWREVLADLRYLPFLWYACHALDAADARHRAGLGVAAVAALWLLDALLQAATGWSLGGPAFEDRLSGIFGADDLKLGGVLAVLSPFLLLPALARSRSLALAVTVALIVVVLLAGARAAWLTLGLVLLLALWRHVGGWRRGVLVLPAVALLGALIGALSYVGSDRFAARIERSVAAFEGAEGLDHALSFRLPIWQAALQMIREHPLNGVGVRGFRHAYAEFAPPGDRWLGFDGDAGAFHAHQWVLEVAAETGAFGLLCWSWAILVGWRVWREAGPLRAEAAAPGLALVALLFPLNTHYAMYSSAWGGLLFCLLALWLPAIAAARREAAPTGQ